MEQEHIGMVTISIQEKVSKHVFSFSNIPKGTKHSSGDFLNVLPKNTLDGELW